MLVRYDFEYPQNRFESSSIKNVAISSEYGEPTGIIE